MTPKDLSVDTTSRIQVVSVEDPPVRQAGAKVDSVDVVFDKLKALGHAWKFFTIKTPDGFGRRSSRHHCARRSL